MSTVIKVLIFFVIVLEKMERMDVKTKLMLLNTYESYWLMLPSEIQEYIMIFKTSQDVIQHRKDYQTALICHEIAQYYKLKAVWGLGPICCKVFKCKCACYKCEDAVHIRICGTNYDVGNVKNVVFLGHTMSGALQRVNHVKSFL